MAKVPKPDPVPKPAKKSRAEVLTAPVKPPAPEDLLSTGCALLDAAFGGGIAKGTYFYLVGDSGTSKSWSAFTMFAEAARNSAFKGYQFVFDNAENGALFDVPTYFGPNVLPRLKPPHPEYAGSPTLDAFYHNVEAAVARGPCVYVLDSMDALQPESEEENFDAKQHFHETGRGAADIKGSMGTAKAKLNAANICRIANQTLRSNGSILVVISQTRDVLNGRFPGMRTRSGGRALKFFAHYEAWGRIKGVITGRARGKEREVGSLIEFDVQKNRGTGWEGKLPPVRFIKGYGLDDVGSSIAYLVDERHWGKAEEGVFPRGNKAPPVDGDGDESPKRIAAPEFDFAGTAAQLTAAIQEQGREAELSALVRVVWEQVRGEAAPKLKSRYGEQS